MNLASGELVTLGETGATYARIGHKTDAILVIYKEARREMEVWKVAVP